MASRRGAGVRSRRPNAGQGDLDCADSSRQKWE